MLRIDQVWSKKCAETNRSDVGLERARTQTCTNTVANLCQCDQQQTVSHLTDRCPSIYRILRWSTITLRGGNQHICN